MEQQSIESADRLISAEVNDLASLPVADLNLANAQANEIKGGPLCHGTTVLAWARVDGVSASNHNETVASDEAELDELEDLLLTTEQEADIKAGCFGCNWGPPVTNHNETVSSDEAELDELEDLLLSAAQEADIKAGCLGCNWGPPMTNHNETVASDEAELDELEDLLLSAAQEADIKAGCLGCNWGPPLTNHNETMTEEETCGFAVFTDLGLTEAEQIKGGVAPSGTGKTLSSPLLGNALSGNTNFELTQQSAAGSGEFPWQVSLRRTR